MEINDANTRLILTEIRKQGTMIGSLPTKSDVKLAVLEGIQEHEDRCDARRQLPEVARRTDEVTGVYKVLRDTSNLRRSMAPAARAIAATPTWVKILVPVALAVLSTLLGVDLTSQ